MSFFGSLFNRGKVDCPRCLGKGHVDLEDIKRFKKELYWAPGKCACCNGTGKVSPERPAMINADIEYLTTNLSGNERKRLLDGDAGAMERSKAHKAEIMKMIEQIEHLYYIENQKAEAIADIVLARYGRFGATSRERQDMVKYVEKVIKSKLSKE